MTAENYTKAINLLHELYGNTQVQISIPVKQFVSLTPVKSTLWTLFLVYET